MSRRRPKRRPRGRPVNGILLFDKPLGMTSNEALQKVKRDYYAAKAGHTGSLDPLATGLLPICFGDATKISAFLLDANKHYVVEAQLGVTTTTGDSEGEVASERPVEAYSEEVLDQALDGFRGDIEQIPPMYSALKHEGQRLYKLARAGKEVEREPRPVTIHAFDVMSRDGDRLTLDVKCSKGTYVRTLVEDLGEVLGCGAHVAGLRRLGVGPFNGDGMHTLDEISALGAERDNDTLDGLLLPVDAALTDWPEVQLTPDSAFYIRQGQPVLVPRAPTEGMVRLYQNEDEFIGIGEILDDGRVAPKRLFIGAP